MTSIHLELPSDILDFVHERMEQNGISRPEDVIISLLKAEQELEAEAKLEALLLEGVRSGPSVKMRPEEWEELRTRLRERHAKKKMTA